MRGQLRNCSVLSLNFFVNHSKICVFCHVWNRRQFKANKHPPVAMPPQAIYINSFAAGLSSGDVFVVMQRNGLDIGVLNMSYTVAKSLGAALNQLILSLEKRSGRNIMTSNEAVQALSKHDENITKLI